MQTEPTSPTAPPIPPTLEIGWVLVGTFERHLDKAVRRARAVFIEDMRKHFPEFDWRAPLVVVSTAAASGDGITRSVEPVALLDLALQERESRRWDFAVAFFGGDLIGYGTATPLGAPSAAIGCAAAGIARLWEPCDDPADKQCERLSVDVASNRISRLTAHLLGHLVGLGHSDEPGDYMDPPHTVSDLDHRIGFGEKTAMELRDELADVADPRLEESETFDATRSYGPLPPDAPAIRKFAGRFGAVRFALLAAWKNGDDVRRILLRIRPWEIPRRLGRLTAAAASSLVVLLMTAETWEAGMSQPAWRVAVLSLASLIAASAYLVHKQRLLIHRPREGRRDHVASRSRPVRLSEQRSVGNVAVILAVVLGMLTTYVALFAVSLTFAWAFYPPEVVSNWAATIPQPVQTGRYLILSAFVAALCLVIGALGAGFEPRGYVRHVAYVDEEV